MRRQAGFTLIEIMVALMIFALMAGIGYRGLDSILKASAHVEEDARKWRALGVAFASIEQALASAVDAPVRGTDGLLAAAFAGAAAVRHDEEALLAFTRMGFPGHSGVLADAQRVGYRLRRDRLELLLWPVLDAAPRSEPQALELLAHVEHLDLRYLARDGLWHAAWPPAKDSPALPAAVELRLRLTTGEQLTRLFALP